MNKQSTIRRTLLAMAIAALGVSGSALGETEQNPNWPAGFSHPLNVGPGGSIAVQGEIINSGRFDPDVDLYTFQGAAGDVFTFDIDVDRGVSSLDANLTLFGPAPAYEILMAVEDVDCAPEVPNPDNLPQCDAGSSSSMDPLIERFVLPATGTYTLAVSTWPVVLKAGLQAGNEFERKMAGTSGAYNLTVSNLSPATQQVRIDVKRQFGPLSPKGTVPVAILWADDFNPFEIDEQSLTFGAKGTEASLRRCNKEGQDMNGKGPRDRMCHFDVEKTGLRKGHTVGVLKGTKNGKAFEGRGYLKVAPEKRGE